MVDARRQTRKINLCPSSALELSEQSATNTIKLPVYNFYPFWEAEISHTTRRVGMQKNSFGNNSSLYWSNPITGRIVIRRGSWKKTKSINGLYASSPLLLFQGSFVLFQGLPVNILQTYQSRRYLRKPGRNILAVFHPEKEAC